MAEAEDAARQSKDKQSQQLPLPIAMRTRCDRISQGSQSPTKPIKRRQSTTSEEFPPPKRIRLLSESLQSSQPVKAWLLDIPKSGGSEHLDDLGTVDIMSQPPSEWSRSRSRSRSPESRGAPQSRDGTGSTVSRDKKYSAYCESNYEVVLETKGSFMRPSTKGMVDEDEELWEKLLTTPQPVPDDLLFDDDHFESFHSNLRRRSKRRVCVDLHPRVVPSVENLAIAGRKEFDCFIEGHNDAWYKCVPFYGPRPQPDHTIGFKWSSFTGQQRRKLGIEPTEKSYYTAREDIYFPFFTSEIKCGRQGLDLADRPNTHSMTVAMRGIVEVYRRGGHIADINRRLTGISVSHDDNGARIYAHYPEIDNDNVTYWRRHPKEIIFRSDEAREKWKCYQVTLNACQMFGLPLLQRLRSIIDELPDSQALLSTMTFEEISVQSSQEDTSGPEDENFRRPLQPRGLNAELRIMIQNLQQQGEQQRKYMNDRKITLLARLEQQRKETKDRECALLAQLEQQRKETKDRESVLLAQLEQQRKETKDRESALLAQLEQQRKESGQQQQELMSLLRQRGEQISQLLSK